MLIFKFCAKKYLIFKKFAPKKSWFLNFGAQKYLILKISHQKNCWFSYASENGLISHCAMTKKGFCHKNMSFTVLAIVSPYFTHLVLTMQGRRSIAAATRGKQQHTQITHLVFGLSSVNNSDLTRHIHWRSQQNINYSILLQ